MFIALLQAKGATVSRTRTTRERVSAIRAEEALIALSTALFFLFLKDVNLTKNTTDAARA